MRHLPCALLLLVGFVAPAHAQDRKFIRPRIEKIRVGFQPFDEREPSAYKAGLWTPVHIEVFGGTEGVKILPKHPLPHIEIECPDNEDVGTRIVIPIAVEEMQLRTFTGYVKTGNRSREIRVRMIDAHERRYEREIDSYSSLEVDAHLYLSLGTRITDLRDAVRQMGRRDDKDDFRHDEMRRVAFETEVERLPDRWFGYNGIDLIVLSTENERFMKALANSEAQLDALAKWVRRGGRLVIPVQWRRQDVLNAVLSHKTAWQPPIPVVPPKDAGATVGVKRLTEIEEFGNVQGKPFHQPDPKNPQKFINIPTATLDPGRVTPGDWDVLATAEGRPLITRVRYGLGQIVYLAVSFEDTDFFNWGGKETFLQNMVRKLGPRAPSEEFVKRGGFVGGGGEMPDDLTTNLVTQLDNFDITVVKFGYVALFIVLYILVVGPLDFLLLKYVFKRLEWTWVTFPTVVLGISIVAYFAAYALKGRDLKINKVDIVDFDLRTDVDAKRQPRSVHAYGRSFFTILSPRIQNYTVGLEPNPRFWGAATRNNEVLSADSLSWIGRPSGGPHDMRRGGSSGFLRGRYSYREDGSGLQGVPIPVWTTKSFTASWEQRLPKSPFKADLVHHHKKEVNNRTLLVSGQLDNHLGVDLTDVWLIYRDRAYPITGGLKMAKGEPNLISIADDPKETISAWVNKSMMDELQATRTWSANPSPLVKNILFHEKVDTRAQTRNHLLRPLDLSWRVDTDKGEQRDGRTREAILFGRVNFVSGNAESVTANQVLPTKLWLGDLPDDGKERPALVGILNQDTFVRVILPVRPAEE